MTYVTPMSETIASPNSNLSKTPTALLRRSRVACKSCNARRVKCDASDGQPCWHCRIRQRPCELLESKRGKYTRKKNGGSRKQASQRSDEAGNISSGQANQNSSTTVTDDAIHRDTVEQSETHPTGDHGNLSYVVEVVYSPEGGSPQPLKVHYPIPASIAELLTPNPGPRAEDLVSLRDAFQMPPRDVADKLIYSFFDIIHPAYPVLDREKFSRLYLQGQASPLILQTIFLLGFTVGSEDLVHAAGYSDRAIARKTHYLRAKALYDADYETDSMNLVAALLLLGFWWAGPEDQKDSCYWVGCATTVAQSLGMHRSMSQSAMSQQVRSMRKRIWWSIYIRDRHTSAAFGRPFRIRDEDCDVERLTEHDLTIDCDYDKSIIPPQKDFHISYLLEMSKLTIILGDILTAEFSARRLALENFNTEELADRLTEWESQLPDTLHRKPLDGSLNAPFWASMLHLSYQNYYILLFRPKAIENLSSPEAERDVRARLAADSITRIAEDLLAAGTIKSGQIHIVPALFGALSIHTIVICQKDLIRRQLAENKSRQCMLALSELAKSWPVKIWIAKAFVNLLGRLTGQGSTVGGSIVNVSSSISRRSNMTSPAGCAVLPQNTDTAQGFFPYVVDANQPTWNGSDNRYLHASTHFLPPDQLLCDPFWAGCLDNTLDANLLFHSSIGQLPLSFQGVNGDVDSSDPSF